MHVVRELVSIHHTLYMSLLGDTAEAIDWYSKGITVLEKGIAMAVHTSGEFQCVCVFFIKVHT